MAAIVALTLASCGTVTPIEGRRREEPTRQERFRDEARLGKGYDVTVDHATGCRYVTGSYASITPLLKRDGTPDCDGPVDAQTPVDDAGANAS